MHSVALETVCVCACVCVRAHTHTIQTCLRSLKEGIRAQFQEPVLSSRKYLTRRILLWDQQVSHNFIMNSAVYGMFMSIFYIITMCVKIAHYIASFSISYSLPQWR